MGPVASAVAFFAFYLGIVAVVMRRRWRQRMGSWLRLLGSVPRVRATDARAGVVHVEGKAAGEATVESPVHGVRCFAYKVTVEEMTQAAGERGASWKLRAVDVTATPFEVKDESGAVRVEADPTATLEFGREPEVQQAHNVDLPDRALGFVRGLGIATEDATGRRVELRLCEWRLDPGEFCVVIGDAQPSDGRTVLRRSTGELHVGDAPPATFLSAFARELRLEFLAFALMALLPLLAMAAILAVGS